MALHSLLMGGLYLRKIDSFWILEKDNVSGFWNKWKMMPFWELNILIYSKADQRLEVWVTFMKSSVYVSVWQRGISTSMSPGFC